MAPSEPRLSATQSSPGDILGDSTLYQMGQVLVFRANVRLDASWGEDMVRQRYLLMRTRDGLS